MSEKQRWKFEVDEWEWIVCVRCWRLSSNKCHIKSEILGNFKLILGTTLKNSIWSISKFSTIKKNNSESHVSSRRWVSKVSDSLIWHWFSLSLISIIEFFSFYVTYTFGCCCCFSSFSSSSSSRFNCFALKTLYSRYVIRIVIAPVMRGNACKKILHDEISQFVRWSTCQ